MIKFHNLMIYKTSYYDDNLRKKAKIFEFKCDVI